eukprot:6172779-Pleurochrysis_carterae.AAC.4
MSAVARPLLPQLLKMLSPIWLPAATPAATTAPLAFACGAAEGLDAPAGGGGGAAKWAVGGVRGVG